MNRKKWGTILLAGSMVTMLSVPCFAEKAGKKQYDIVIPTETQEEEIMPEGSVKPQEHRVRVIDEKGNPIPNLCVQTYGGSGASPQKDTEKEKKIAYTDENGVATLCIFQQDTADRFYVDYCVSYGNGEEYSFQKAQQADGEYRVIWKGKTPKERFKDKKEGVRIYAVSKDGKPISGLEVKAIRKSTVENWQPEWSENEVFDLWGYTDENGYFYGFNEADGSDMKLTLTKTGKNAEKQTKTYIIVPKKGKQNCYKIVW